MPSNAAWIALTKAQVLLGAMPRLLRSILARAVGSQADMEVTEAEELAESDLDSAIARSRADVLIVADRTGKSEARYRKLLLSRPSLKVFLLTEDGRNATLLEFTRARLMDASPAAIVEAIRTVVSRDSTLG
jgi:DNA-binding NarL/FixJ family response regulator